MQVAYSSMIFSIRHWQLLFTLSCCGIICKSFTEALKYYVHWLPVFARDLQNWRYPHTRTYTRRRLPLCTQSRERGACNKIKKEREPPPTPSPRAAVEICMRVYFWRAVASVCVFVYALPWDSAVIWIFKRAYSARPARSLAFGGPLMLMRCGCNRVWCTNTRSPIKLNPISARERISDKALRWRGWHARSHWLRKVWSRRAFDVISLCELRESARCVAPPDLKSLEEAE